MADAFLTARLPKTYADAGKKYGWGSNVDGVCLEYNFLSICEMAGKDARIIIRGRKRQYRIAPTVAKEVAKEHKSFFTRSRDQKLIVVVPINRLETI